jgi:hypothetical protein
MRTDLPPAPFTPGGAPTQLRFDRRPSDALGMSPGLWIAFGIVALLACGLALRSRDTRVTLPGPGERLPSASQLAAASSEADPDFAARLPRMMLRPRETGFFGRWWEGRLRDCPVAFQPFGKGVSIIAGDFDPDQEQISDVYLSQAGEAQPLPAAGSARRLRSVLGDSAGEIDERFFLNATGGDLPGLRSAAVRSALLGLSDSVDEVMLFESGGVQLITDADATPGAIAGDLERAVELHAALRTLR